MSTEEFQFNGSAGSLIASGHPSSLGINLDGCVDEAPVLFELLTHHWPGVVFVVTYRKDRTKTEADLAGFGVRYDELILVDSFDAKAGVIVEKRISVYFDDQPEVGGRAKSLEARFDEHLVKPPGVEALKGLLIHPKLGDHAAS